MADPAITSALVVRLLPAQGAEGAFRRDGEPITFGVPLPRGWATDAGEVSLTADGCDAPIQTRVLERWDDNSVRWILIDTLANTDDGGAARYELASGAAASPIDSEGLRVTSGPDGIIVDTGAARFSLRAGTASVFHDVSVAGASLLDPLRSGFIATAADGRPYEVLFDNLSVCDLGALRVEVVAVGTARRSSSRGLPLRVTMRLQFFRHSGIVRSFVTLTNPNPARHPDGYWELGAGGSELLREACVVLALGSSDTVSQIVCSPEPGVGPEAVTQPLEIVQESSGGPNWASPAHRNGSGIVPVRARGYRLSSPGTSRIGTRATPVISLRRENQTLSVAVPQFWENSPKALEVSEDVVSIGLFPRQHRDLHELQGGEQKTHAFTIAFGHDTVTAEPLVWCRAPLVASVEGAGAGVMPPARLTVGTSAVQRQYEALVRTAIEGDNSFVRKRELIDEYGWRHFGDLYADHEAVARQDGEPLVSHYNNQYDAIAGFAAQFLWSGDRRWWTLMNELAAHVVDVDLYHTNGDKPAYNNGYFWHTNHYIDAGTATHRAYPRDSGTCGGGPSCEHNYTTGLMWHYFLTGSALSRDAVVQLADWVLAMDDGGRTSFGWLDAGPTGLASATYSPDFHGPGRGAANSINALLDGHRVTSDATYLRKAEELVRRCIHPADDQDADGLADPESRWSYTVFLQVLGKYLEYRFERGLVDAEYEHARASLLQYARWMAAHEAPYLDRPERLQFPTETWAAQDIRKAAVFEFAARHAAATAERNAFLERAAFFLDVSVSTVSARPTCALTRPVVLLLAYGFQRPVLDLANITLTDWRDGHFGRRAEFVAYKRRLLRRALMVGAASAAAGVVLVATLLLR